MKRCAQATVMEELALGTLSLDRAARAEAHAAGCTECRAELARLRRERELFVRRARVAPAVPLDVEGVFARLQQEAPVPIRPWSRISGRVASGFAALAAAAAVVIAAHAWNLVPWSILALRDATGTTIEQDEDPSVREPVICNRSACLQTTLFASDCEPMSCWQPAAFASRRESAYCSQINPLDWEGARCEADPLGNP